MYMITPGKGHQMQPRKGIISRLVARLVKRARRVFMPGAGLHYSRRSPPMMIVKVDGKFVQGPDGTVPKAAEFLRRWREMTKRKGTRKSGGKGGYDC